MKDLNQLLQLLKKEGISLNELNALARAQREQEKAQEAAHKALYAAPSEAVLKALISMPARVLEARKYATDKGDAIVANPNAENATFKCRTLELSRFEDDLLRNFNAVVVNRKGVNYLVQKVAKGEGFTYECIQLNYYTRVICGDSVLVDYIKASSKQN